MATDRSELHALIDLLPAERLDSAKAALQELTLPKRPILQKVPGVRVPRNRNPFSISSPSL
jgi:hypothetical protein